MTNSNGNADGMHMHSVDEYQQHDAPIEPTHQRQSSAEDDEDRVGEMTSLLENGQHPGMSSYTSRTPVRRSASEESITTVSALPGMVIRSHSVHANCHESDAGETIQHSTSKVALRAVQLERRSRAAAELKKQKLSNGGDNVEGGVVGGSRPRSNIPSSGGAPILGQHYWIDIETPNSSSDELHDFLNQLRLPAFFISLLSEPSGNWSSEVVALKQAALAVFQILPVTDDTNEITNVALLTVPRLLVTFSTRPRCETEGLYHCAARYMRERERMPEPTHAGALLAWLQFHVGRTSRAIRELRTATLDLDRELDRDFANFNFEDIVDTKNGLLRVFSVAEEQRGTIEALANAEDATDGLDFGNCRGALAVLLATSAANERLSSRVDKHLNELRDRIMTHREEVLNRRLALLTILSAIFMPLTLLTGIWGMNFESMPELEMQGAYQKALAGMFLLALCMVFSFYRSGWADH